MLRRQNNIYTLTRSNGQTLQVSASNVQEVARAVKTFKLDVITIQREPSAKRSYKVKKV